MLGILEYVYKVHQSLLRARKILFYKSPLTFESITVLYNTVTEVSVHGPDAQRSGPSIDVCHRVLLRELHARLQC